MLFNQDLGKAAIMAFGDDISIASNVIEVQAKSWEDVKKDVESLRVKPEAIPCSGSRLTNQ